MNPLASMDPALALNEYINELLLSPIRNEKFTATFSRADNSSGSVLFTDNHSQNQATALWEMYIENGTVRAVLKYNGWLTLLNTPAGLFREQVSSTFPIF